MICVSLSSPNLAVLERQMEENLAWTSFFEFRLDQIPLELLPWILRPQRPYQALITLTPSPSPEGYSRSERIRILQSALEQGAEWIDWNESTPFPTAHPERVIYSYHDYQKTPSLHEIQELFQARFHPPSGIKLVFFAQNIEDNFKIQEFLQSVLRPDSPPLIAFCMGMNGQTSRILTLKWGGAWTYTAPDPEYCTAPGQITAKKFRQDYPQLLEKTPLKHFYGILGKPVSQSLSPLLHNHAFQEKNIPALYLPLETETPESCLESSFFQGFSVTMPYKTRLREHPLVKNSPEVLQWKALNTLRRKGGKYESCNTDVPASLEILKKRVGSLKGKKIILWGSGGLAQALALALANEGALLGIQARNTLQGQALAQACHGQYYPWGTPFTEKIHILIQTTPIGMSTDSRKPASLRLFSQGLDLLFESISLPYRSPLVEEAEELKIPVLPGILLLLQQAQKQQEFWTNSSYPLEKWVALLQALKILPQESFPWL
jgi:shikimate 5-dehydrogenase/3-dehydroquinate dehydratase